MNTRVEAIAIPDGEAEASVKPDTWSRVRDFVGTPYLPVAALAFIAAAASAVWFRVGGSWWFPLSAAVSTVSIIAVWWCVYKCWLQRKVIHQSLSSKNETPRDAPA
jgi:hypothetical protein